MKNITLLVGGITIVVTALLASNGAGAATAAEDPEAIRPFHANISQEAIDDLRKRILATRWPDKETVSDQSQGVPLATT
jgi:hypothetical protein